MTSQGNRRTTIVGALAVIASSVLASNHLDAAPRRELRGRAACPGNDTVTLPKTADGRTRVRDRATGMSIAFSLIGSRPAKADAMSGITAFRAGGPEGSDVLVRRTDAGVEDFLRFEKRATVEALRYVVDVREASGLRFVDNVLEFLDAGGAPRLRMDAPSLVEATGALDDARIVLEDCRADTDARPPWGRPVTPSGRPRCVVRVEWNRPGANRAYPLIVDPTWTATANTMTVARAGHTATVLTGGKVLIVGGQRPNAATPTYLNSTELFDPGTNTFAAGPALAGPRSLHVAVRLSNGDVLVAGGAAASGALTTTELYETSTGKFRSVGVLKAARQDAAAVELSGGKVLITGGIAGANVLQTAELYDTTSETWTFTVGNMVSPRFGHSLTLLPLGQAFVIGGASTAAANLVVTSADYYTASTDRFSVAPSLVTGRFHFGAAPLPDTRVLVVSGATSSTETAAAEIFDPNTAAWSSAGTLAHARTHHRVALLGGSVVATGGVEGAAKTVLRSVELFDSAAKKWSALGDMLQPRYDHTATALADGRVLVAGGNTSATAATATAEILSLDKDGAPCKVGSTCGSGQCVDGVCCDTACTTSCFGCSKASTGLADGTCGPALAGKDPHGSCKDDGAPDCGNDGFCDGAGACEQYPAKPCTPSPCTKADECTSGNCADGVCCDQPCSGACEACTVAKKGKGASGTCGPIAAGTDPDKECGPMGSAGCQGDATCDGSGACRVPNAGKSCAQAKCFDDVTLSEAATCSAAGDCTPTKTSCSPYQCDSAAAACKTTCATAADCAAGGACVSGACHLKDDGESCAGGGECTSNHCVDGVCCDTACPAQCSACDVSGSKGKCSPATGAPHGSRAPCDGTAPCAGECNGRLTDTCSYPSGNSCGPAVGCTDGGETAQRCNGFGRCVDLPTKGCAPFACGAEACKTSCANRADCAFGYVCDSKSSCVLANQPACVDGSGSGCPAPAAAAAEESGCGCRTVRASATSAASWLLALAFGAGVRLRRARVKLRIRSNQSGRRSRP